MLFNRIIGHIKHSSRATLRAWSYQCESIFAQRSRRIQQLFTFYHRVYGANGLKQLLRSYHRQLEAPLHGLMLSAAGIVGLNEMANSGFDWSRERLSLSNFDMCMRDIEFIETLSYNELCPLCQEKQMKYCYCQLGNKKCRKGGKDTIRNCQKAYHKPAEPNTEKKIECADEVPWEPYLSKNQFSIWRREERSAMYAYKVYARFDDITAADLLHVQTDLKYRKVWDDSAITLDVIEEDPQPNSNSHLIYWEMRWPQFFANRDYVYSRRFVTDDELKVMLVCSRGTNHPSRPPTKDKVRVLDYWSIMVIKPYRSFHEPGVHYILTYYDDPGLAIPQSIKSWVTQKQMPDFLEKMYAATRHYAFKNAALIRKKMHQLSHFDSIKDDYTANAERSNPKPNYKMWRKRGDSGN